MMKMNPRSGTWRLKKSQIWDKVKMMKMNRRCWTKRQEAWRSRRSGTQRASGLNMSQISDKTNMSIEEVADLGQEIHEDWRSRRSGTRDSCRLKKSQIWDKRSMKIEEVPDLGQEIHEVWRSPRSGTRDPWRLKRSQIWDNVKMKNARSGRRSLKKSQIRDPEGNYRLNWVRDQGPRSQSSCELCLRSRTPKLITQ